MGWCQDIELYINRKIDVLLLITSFTFDTVLILEIMIKDYSINHHLLQRYLLDLKSFSNPIFLRICESGRVPLYKIRNSGQSLKISLVNVKYLYKDKCVRDEEDAGSFI